MMKRITILALTTSLLGCLLGVEVAYLESRPVNGQDPSYSLSGEEISWNGIRTKFNPNNRVVLRSKVTKAGEFSEWNDTPEYESSGQTPFAISMLVELGESERMLVDAGGVKLELLDSRVLTPTIVSVEATGWRTVCTAMGATEMEYSQPTLARKISLADLPETHHRPHTSDTWGCIRFIFDLPVEEMNPSKKFSFTIKFILDGKERSETVYFGPREYTVINA